MDEDKQLHTQTDLFTRATSALCLDAGESKNLVGP